MHLTLSSVVIDGWPGLRDGLALLRGVVEQYWETAFPRLDPDDGNDPTERLNIIAAMTIPPDSYGDTMQFNARLRSAPIVESSASAASRSPTSS